MYTSISFPVLCFAADASAAVRTPEERVRDFIVLFTSILYEALPFIALGAVIAGILEVFIPQRYVLRLIPKNRSLAIAVGCLLGLPFPMCECGILVIMRRLIRKGVPLSVGVSYMLAGPIINGVVMLSTAVAFAGWKEPYLGGLGMMGLRMAGGFLVAFGTGLIVEWQHRKHGDALLAPSLLADVKKGQADEEEEAKGARPSLLRRVGNVAETALHDFVDVTVYLIIGALIAAFVRQLLNREELEQIAHGYPVLTIVLMMGLAVLLCLCSEADAFVARSFVELQPSAVFSFLVLGPMLDFKLYFMYTRVFSHRLIRIIITSVVLQVLFWSLVLHVVWGLYGLPAQP